MEAPKLRGMFRNVRTKPRSFDFKSRHLADARPEWVERKRRIEEQVSGISSNESPAQIRFSRSKRRESNKRDARKATIRTVLIGVVLLYVAYRVLIWAETTEFGEMLEFIRDNG